MLYLFLAHGFLIQGLFTVHLVRADVDEPRYLGDLSGLKKHVSAHDIVLRRNHMSGRLVGCIG